MQVKIRPDKRLLIGIVLLSCAGCVGNPHYEKPCPPPVAHYTPTHTEEKSLQIAYDDFPNARWWEAFASPKLNRLVERGFQSNPTLEVARATLEQAKESAIAAGGEKLWPDVNAGFGVEREKFSTAVFGDTSGRNNIFNLFNTNLNVTYTLDIFGKYKRELEALCAQVAFERYQLHGAYLSLSANIVTTAILQATYAEQVAALGALLSAQEQQLDLLKKQLALGGINESAVLSQETLVESTRAARLQQVQNHKEATHLLAILIGDYPSEAAAYFTLSELRHPEKVPVSLPSEVAHSRPDIQAAEALIKQATANVGVATANFFPQISISGAYGWQSNLISDLFTSQANIWNMAANVVQPVFKGRSLIHRRKESLAALRRSQALYHETVLNAFKEVADGIERVDNQTKAAQAQNRALLSARSNFNLVSQQFKLGAVDYITVLIAQQDFQAAQIEQINQVGNELTSVATLYQAVGGSGWCQWPETPAKTGIEEQPCG